ncbi:TetR/AcrR family transcriptional regulator [Streptomyces salinarius]|uniref:TetR/AcrR family transcriptional regulator n=1 Tax=Streptomyces salinarius TaxID=2762598 RepID=UPI0013DC04B1|nr:TetR/AcrR family transcriptional regulator [Streptomyces salinarius]
MSSPSAERGRETKRRLVEATAQLIDEEGWGAVTTRKVAERAGLRPGLVHYHFGSVNDLLVDAALVAVRQEVLGAMAMMRQAGDVAEGLGHILHVVTGYGTEDATSVLFNEAMLAARHSDRLRSELAGLLAQWRAAVTEWLRTSGGLDDAEPVATLLSAALDGLVLHRMIDPSMDTAALTGPLRRLVGVEDPAGAHGHQRKPTRE